ncbi:Cytochrome P450 oxidoreductase, putative [Talaromyces islandicus]|uniref:Cytochrome P450 oxidoreductase, putative n=1 Tax=Talaromyces islandicus TaxID=28573 RepID=A0A0U1M220_TALIS|nr:Cytochrome P450 oxidoreductase, putative [Talaromyces islandicus]
MSPEVLGQSLSNGISVLVSDNGGTQAIEDAISLSTYIYMAAAGGNARENLSDATRVHNLLRFERVSCLQAFGVQNRKKIRSDHSKPKKGGGDSNLLHVGKWILNYDSETYTLENYQKALEHLKNGTPFLNTNTPPGLSPSLELCYKECIRMWVAFPMGRVNERTTDIKIPGTNEIIPAGGLASYNTIDVLYNERLHPQPLKWDPARFGEGRKEMEKEAHGFMWQNMVLAYALAMYKWTGCFADRSANPEFIPPTTALNELAPALPQNLYCMAIPREKT